MRQVRAILLTGCALWATPAVSADALKYGAAPAWVVQQPIPEAKPSEAPIAMLLNDQQIAFDHGKITDYTELAFKIQNPQGLGAGSLSIVWQPATDTVTVNKVQIRRGDKIIDVLGAGQTFTILRRETNLDAAMLDGTLTANIQPEQLQEGDIIDFATTTERLDPILKGHAEAVFAGWNSIPIQTSHALLTWPAELKVNLRQSDGLPAAHRFTRDGRTILELSATGIEPIVPPNGAPERFKIGRLAEATDFSSWADLAGLMSPLYRSAAVIPASGPLHDEVERIRSASSDPKRRAELALALVQDRVRYVALEMGLGGYVPATAEQTWSRRFGDCKAKTALLLGILASFGIRAEPVLVQSTLGDIVADRLPMLQLFDHVLVRAHIAGKDYWLDGTRTGDTSLGDIPVPDFGWGLPLVEHAQLVRMVPRPLDLPNLEHHLNVDASAGVFAPATVTIDEVYRGDSAIQLNAVYSALTSDQRDKQMRDQAKTYFDGFAMSSSSIQFDKAKRQLNLTIKGTAKLNWKNSWAYVPTSSIGFDPDFDRPVGRLHDLPWAVNHPRYVKDEAIIRLPAGFAAQQKRPPSVHETLAGVEYARSETVAADVLTVDSSERSLAPEIAYKDALAAASRLRAISKDDVYLSSSVSYRPTEKDLVALADSTPGSADEYVDRGNWFLDGQKYDQAIADYNEALKLEPSNKWALADRGLARVWKRDFDQAEKDLSTAEASEPDNGLILRARALMAEFKGDCTKAVDFYTRSLAKEPGRNFNVGHRAMCEAQLSKFDEALAAAAEVLKADPSWMDLRLLRSNILLRQGKPELVAAEAEALTRDNPKSEYAWVAAAKAYAALGQRPKAMQIFDRALAMKPSADIYVNRESARPKSDIAGRKADIEAALKLEPDNVDALEVKALMLSDSGDYKGALAILDQIKAPDDQYVPEERAALLYKVGRTAEAEKLLQSVRAGAKTAPQLNSLCWFKATKGVSLDSALQDCRDALTLSPNTGAYLDSLGMVLLRLGKLDEALDAYTQAIAKGTGADSLMGRAFVYLRKGDRPRAEADAVAARKIYPEIDASFADYGLKFGETASSTPAAH